MDIKEEINLEFSVLIVEFLVKSLHLHLQTKIQIHYKKNQQIFNYETQEASNLF